MRLACRSSLRLCSSMTILFLSWLPFLAGPAYAQKTPSLSREAFTAEVASLQQLVAACAANAGSCDGGKVPAPQQVSAGPDGSFHADWGWLKEALQTAKAASAKDRASGMRVVESHLAVLSGQAGAMSISPPAAFRQTRAAANATLARAEFQSVTQGPTWWDRQLARMQDAILRLLFGMGKLGERAPWLAPAIEWSCFGLAAAGLLWFVRRNLVRQALRISLTEGAALASRGDGKAADWARLAAEQSAAGRWREAVHSLYWAAIALLEGRRAWRPNTTRTPREYLPLLRPGSEAEQALRQLTRSLERIWYGDAEADEAQYLAAMACFRTLETAKPERAGRSGTEQASAAGTDLPAAGEA